MSGKDFKYLEGLNSCRFFAAFFVVIYHARSSLVKLGLMPNIIVPVLSKGTDAVDFFFTLSGFLITYLLLQENNERKDISIGKFYARRVLRIWPVYFLIVFVRFFLDGIIGPYVFHAPSPDVPILKGLLLYVFFLPNLATVLYEVGLLHPLWSIGVEEQFYLLWAPLFKWFKNNVKSLLITAMVICVAWYALVSYNVFGFNPVIQEFCLSQKFYAMITGAAFGYILFQHLEGYEKSFFARGYVQCLVLAVLIFHYFVSNQLENNLLFRIMAPVLYGLFILNVSAIKNKIISLEKAPFVFLGKISYGIYMYHMVVNFGLRRGFKKLPLDHLNHPVMGALYFVLLLAGSIGLAWLSYTYFESRFLRIKHKYSTT